MMKYLSAEIWRTQEVAAKIDEEVRKLIDECYAQAKTMLLENKDVLHRCAELLIEKERIGRDEFEGLFGEQA